MIGRKRRPRCALDLVARSTAALEARYTGLPDDIRADREYQGLVAETMGVLGATKVTMGQAARTVIGGWERGAALYTAVVDWGGAAGGTRRDTK